MRPATGVVAALLVASWWPGRRRKQPIGPAAPRHLSIATRARSADGATVRLVVRVDYLLEADAAPRTVHALADAAEREVRESVQTRRVLSLPGVGDSFDLPDPQQVPGVRVQHMEVITADVEITRELRRLVGGP